MCSIVHFGSGYIHIGPNIAGLIFYISLAVVLLYLILFFVSFKKVFHFSTTSMTIDFQINMLNFDERESFISKIEDAKDQRHQQIYGGNKKN